MIPHYDVVHFYFVRNLVVDYSILFRISRPANLLLVKLSFNHLTLTKGSAANNLKENNMPKAETSIIEINLFSFIIFSSFDTFIKKIIFEFLFKYAVCL